MATKPPPEEKQGPAPTPAAVPRAAVPEQTTAAPLGAGTAASINEPPGSTIGANVPPTAPEGSQPLDIDSLDPEEADVGDPDLTLHVYGTGFTSDCVIVFNGGDEATTFVSDTELTTGVKPSLVGAPIVVPVHVRRGAEQSDALEFEFLAEEGAATASKTRKRTKTKAKR